MHTAQWRLVLVSVAFLCLQTIMVFAIIECVRWFLANGSVGPLTLSLIVDVENLFVSVDSINICRG